GCDRLASQLDDLLTSSAHALPELDVTPASLSRRRTERNADDVESAVQPVEGEAAQLVGGRAENRFAGALGRCQGLGDRRQHFLKCRANDVGPLRAIADRLAQKPGAVADVALLIVRDLGVARDEARQQPSAL